MRPEKTTIVDDLSTKLNHSPFLIVTEYNGMNVLQFFGVADPSGRSRCPVQGGQKYVPAQSRGRSGIIRIWPTASMVKLPL